MRIPRFLPLLLLVGASLGLGAIGDCRAQSLEDLMAVYNERCRSDLRAQDKSQGPSAARQGGRFCDDLAKQIQSGTETLETAPAGSLVRPNLQRPPQ